MKIITKIKNSKIAITICAFVIPFAMMMVFWAVCKIYPFGDSSILTGDMDIEFVDFYAYFINTLKSKNDWSYMLTKTLGGDYPGLAAFILHDPLLYILLLFPGEKIALGIEFLLTIQISLAGLCASVLLNNRYKRSWMSLLFSTGYAFSAFFFGYLVLTIYFTAIAILPLVLYFFLEFLEEKRSSVAFVISAALFIYINYHMGFMLVIFLGLLYISRIIADTSYIGRFRSVAISGITVILIDGLFLIRTGLSLIGEKTTQGADYGFYRRFPLDRLLGGMFSGYVRNDLRPLIYCSVAAFFFMIVYFLISKNPLREKLAELFLLAAVSVSMWINSIDAVWHGFNNPEGFYWRYAYYISMITIVLGYKGFVALFEDDDLTIKNRSMAVIIPMLCLVFYIAWLLLWRDPYLDLERALINVAVIIAVTLTSLLMIKGGNKRIIGFTALLIVSVTEMLYNAKTLYIYHNSPSQPLPKMADFWEDYRDISDVISYVKDQDRGFYRIEKDFDRAVNDPSMFDYIGLSHDSSCEKDELLDWMVNFGFCKTVYFLYYNGGSTAFVDDLFGIRYYISRFDSVEKPYDAMSYEGKYHVYENKNALPIAYISPDGLKDADISKGNTFEKQNLIASYWSDEPIFIKASAEVTTEGAKETEPGRYVRTDEEGYIVYTIDITKNMPLYFYFYAPERQNGEVFVNGDSRDVYFTVNHWNTLCAGTYDAGDTVEIRMQIKEDELRISEACFYYEDSDALEKWGKSASSLNRSIGPVEEIKSSHFRFLTSGKEDNTVIMSIPYDEAWTVRCDSKPVTCEPAMGMLMSFNVPSGDHEIDMIYTPRGTYIGLIVSFIGILIFLGSVVLNMPKDKRRPWEKLLKRSKLQKLKKEHTI